MFWRKKKPNSKLDDVFDFRRNYKPTYTTKDLDIALDLCSSLQKEQEDKSDQYLKAAKKIAEDWKYWMEDKGIKHDIKIEVKESKNPIIYPRVYLRVSDGQTNEIFEVELNSGYNDKVMRIVDFVNNHSQ